jgi:hypothetical protein
MDEDDLKEVLQRFMQGTDNLSGAANTVSGRLLQLARSSSAASEATDAETMSKKRSVAAADGLVAGFKGLANAAGTVISGMVSVPAAMATSTEAFTAVKPMVGLFTSVLSTLSSAVFDAVGGFTKFIPILGNVVEGLQKLGEGVIRLAGEAINFQLDATQRLVNNFNQLSKAGLVFGASLEQAKAAAAAGGLSLQSFTSIVSNQAANLALLGGNSEQAAVALVGAGKQMSAGLRTIYGGFEGLNTELIETVALQSQLGVRQSRNQQELAATTEPYLLNLKEISLLTGKSTQQIRDEQKQRSQSAAYQNAYANASADAQKNLTNTLSQLTPQAAAYAQELFAAQAVGADITSQTNLRLQAMAPELTDKLRQLIALKDLPPEEFAKRQAQLLQDVGQAGKDLQKTYGYELFLQSAGRGPELFNLLNSSISELTSQSNRLASAVEAQASAAQRLSGIQNTFTTTIDDVNTELLKLQSTIESIALGKFQTTADIVKLSIEGAQLLSAGLDKITDLLAKFVPSTGTTPPPTTPGSPVGTGPGTAQEQSQVPQTATSTVGSNLPNPASDVRTQAFQQAMTELARGQKQQVTLQEDTNQLLRRLVQAA